MAAGRKPGRRHAGGQAAQGGGIVAVTPGHAGRWAGQVMVKTCVRPVIVNVFMALELGD